MGIAKGCAFIAGVVCAVLACEQPVDGGASRRLAELDQRGREINASLDRLEERFLAVQSKVDLWEELRDRHQHVSAVVALNAQGHLFGILRHYEHQEAKWRSNQQKRRQWASRR